MSKTIVVGAMALAALIAGVALLTKNSDDDSAATVPSASEQKPAAGSATPVPAEQRSASQGSAATPNRATSQPAPQDPRLAALAVSPDNGLIKFVTGDNGKVIAEIDQDPASLGFGKPSREYIYAGDKVVGLTAYRYMSDHVEISRTAVAYQPDGSVDEIRESISYDRDTRK